MQKSTEESAKKARKKIYITPKLEKLDKSNLTHTQKIVVAELEKKLDQWKKENVQEKPREDNSA